MTLNGILNVDGDVERSLDDDGDGDEVENGLLCFDYELIGIWDLGSLFFDWDWAEMQFGAGICGDLSLVEVGTEAITQSVSVVEELSGQKVEYV